MVAIEQLLDPGSFAALSDGLEARDPIDWPGYRDALTNARDDHADESVLYGPATIAGHDVEFAGFSFSFLGGSMGEVAGERLARSMGRAVERGVPFVLRTSTGGARIQEGMRSLAQMPRVVAARIALGRAGIPYICVLGNPTTGGVLASVGSLADVTLAETGATIGFAGPRLVEMFTGTSLRTGSHTAASALAHGLVDDVVDEREERARVGAILQILGPDDPRPPDEPAQPAPAASPSGWSAVLNARSPERPRTPQLIPEFCEAHFELRGDRAGDEDGGIVTAICRTQGRRALVVGFDVDRSPGPAAFRKARRCISIAGRLRLPIVTLIDTRGADPSEDSEAGGIAWAIADVFQALLTAEVPVLAVVTGEGGSGGALALAAADRVIAFAGSIFSVIAPESAATVLWRDPERAPQAAELLRLGASDLHRLGIADALVTEPLDGDRLRAAVAYHLASLAGDGSTPDERVQRRLRRWRNGR